jgi:hypothetical protein
MPIRFIKAKTGETEQLQARRGDVTLVMFPIPFRKHKKRDKQLISRIKVIKRSRKNIPNDRPVPGESKSVEPSAHEITIVVKNWIAESRQSKRSQKQFSSLFLSQMKGTN